MKKHIALLIGLVLPMLLFAQAGAKKYLLIEHFTNSNCPPCASKNPAFYNLITQAQYADDLHHVSVHPMFPYPQCVFYQANTTENTAWTSLYPISGTPSIVLNGVVQGSSNPMLSEAKLQTYLGQTSPLSLQVTESGPNNARSVNVKAKALGDIPSGNYKIFAAIVEKTINQQTPNGETVHRNVFRKMLTAVSGDAFAIPAAGETKEFNFGYSMSANWNGNEIYVLVFVKEVDTKQVLNSGTRFDPVLSGTTESAGLPVHISPNPGFDRIQVQLPEERVLSVTIFSSNGQEWPVSWESNATAVEVPVGSLSKGMYFVKIRAAKGNYVGRFVKG